MEVLLCITSWGFEDFHVIPAEENDKPFGGVVVQTGIAEVFYSEYHRDVIQRRCRYNVNW